MCDVKRRAMCDVQVTACLLCLVLFQAVCVNATPEGALRVKRAGDVNTTTSQTSEEGSLMTMMMMMQAELTSLKNTVSSLENNVTSLKTTVSSLENNVTSLKTTVSSLENNVTSLRTTVSILEDRLNNVQNASSLTVAFTARISNDRDRRGRGLPLGFQQTVVFNDILTNVGNAYNNHSGLFTAPVDGTYVFFLTLMAVTYHGTDIYLVIVKNGAVLDTAMAEGGRNFHDQGSSLVSTQLRQGDHVWVRQNDGDAVRGYHWTVFTGYLLHAQ